MSIWTWLWIIWAAFFGVIEGTAIIKKAPNSTLTWHIVSWASLKDKSGDRETEHEVVITIGPKE